MARNARRTYARDARGRFASSGSSRPTATGGSLKARTSARRSRQRLAGMDQADASLKGTLSRRSQRGAVTRTAKAAAEARKANRVRLPARAGVVRPGRRRSATGAATGANNIRRVPTRKTAAVQGSAANGIRRVPSLEMKVARGAAAVSLPPHIGRMLRAKANYSRAQRQGGAMKDLLGTRRSYTNRDVQAATGARSIRQITNSLNTTAKAAAIYMEMAKRAGWVKSDPPRGPGNGIRPGRRRRKR